MLPISSRNSIFAPYRPCSLFHSSDLFSVSVGLESATRTLDAKISGLPGAHGEAVFKDALVKSFQLKRTGIMQHLLHSVGSIFGAEAKLDEVLKLMHDE